MSDHIVTLPQKNEKATLKSIVERWNPPALITDTLKPNRSMMYGLLPDLINKSKVEQGCIDLADRNDAHFVDGCWRTDGKKITYYDKEQVTKLRCAITQNAPITYKGRQEPSVGCRDNMLHKIYYFVQQSDVKSITPLFTDLQLHPFPELQGTFEADFRNAIQKLYQVGTKKSFTYGIFLLILHSVFHRDMAELHFLYSGDELSEVLRSSAPKTDHSSMMPENHVFLCDQLYSHNYSAYMFRDNYDRLYETGYFELKCDGGVPSAELLLDDLHAAHPVTHNADPVTHKYVGTPILSKRDNLIYILMHDINDANATGIMLLQYTSFSNGHPCYYRSGLFASSDHKRYPEVRKIVLTERELTEEELPTVQGILKMTSRHIIMSERRMDAFCEDYKDQYKWLTEFKKSIPVYHKNWYCFDDRYVMTNADPELDELERLKLTLAMKSYCRGACEPFNRIHCKENPNIFKIMR